MQAEYDFSPGVRGKYARRYTEGTNDVAKVFPNAEAVNKSLQLGENYSSTEVARVKIDARGHTRCYSESRRRHTCRYNFAADTAATTGESQETRLGLELCGCDSASTAGLLMHRNRLTMTGSKSYNRERATYSTFTLRFSLVGLRGLIFDPSPLLALATGLTASRRR